MTATTTRVADLATQVEAANQQLIDAAQRCSDEQWRQRSASEGWTVGVLAHHVAISYEPIAGMVQAVADGREPKLSTTDGQADMNARHAREYAQVGKQETVDALRRHGAAAADTVRNLRDVQLTRTTTAFGGKEMTVEQLIQGAVIGHPRQHLASIREALGS
jgi:uncharacterized damage-inducible protein DinB